MTMLQYYQDDRRRVARQILELLEVQHETRPTASRKPERLADVRRREQELLDWCSVVLDEPPPTVTLPRLGGAA